MAVFFLKHQRKGKIKLICNREKRRFLSVISKLHAVSLLLEEDSTKYKTNKQKVELGVKSSQNRARVTSPVSHTSQSARSTDTPATVPARPALPRPSSWHPASLRQLRTCRARAARSADLRDQFLFQEPHPGREGRMGL
jgi:hypothetical protein